MMEQDYNKLWQYGKVTIEEILYLKKEFNKKWKLYEL